MMFRDMVESVMLLKEEACGGPPGEGLQAGAAGGRAGAQTHPCAAATYAVRVPHALLPPSPLVLPDEPGRGALFGGAAQPGDMELGGKREAAV